MFPAWLTVGALLGAVAIWLNGKEAARQRERNPNYEVWSWAVFLLLAALIYVGFAIFGEASRYWLWVELAGVGVFGMVAFFGAARMPVFIGIGWLAHTLWDQALHPAGAPGYVPSWYPPVCLGFDVYVGVALILRFRTRTPAPIPAE